MSTILKKPIIPCLWFNEEAEEAAKLYISIFPDSGIDGVSRYPDAGKEFHGKKPGTAMTVSFHLNGQHFVGLNGGPNFPFSEAISFQVFCDTQEEIDHYWNRLTEGGSEGQCGWLKDKFGVSWQVIPSILPALLSDAKKAPGVMTAFLRMKKFNIAELQSA
jgi:predicted 3-demethylubiquinone-9 3-methyltransferase (glyoxalase superfamily)